MFVEGIIFFSMKMFFTGFKNVVCFYEVSPNRASFSFSGNDVMWRDPRVFTNLQSVMGKECASADCREIQHAGSSLSFHKFPLKDPARLQQWLVNMNRLDPKTKKLWQPASHDVLCSKHFEESCFTMRTRINREEGLPHFAFLEPDAVPTLFSHREDARKRSLAIGDRRTAAAKRRRQQVIMITSKTFTKVTKEREVYAF